MPGETVFKDKFVVGCGVRVFVYHACRQHAGGI